MKLIYCLMILLCPVVNGIAQTAASKIRILTTGELLPDTKLTSLPGKSGTSFSLADYKGKLVILDFWATWCGACIEEFPKLEQLQKEFRDQVKIVLVNDQHSADAAFLNSFFEKRKARTGMGNSLTTVVGDTTLKTYFPHQTIPHCVWIDPSGKLAAVTYPEELTVENIRKMLEGRGAPATNKRDDLRFDDRHPLLTAKNGSDPAGFLYRSLITPFMENLGSVDGTITNDSGSIARFYYLNTPLVSLYTFAYPNVFTKDIRDILFEVPGVKFQDIYCYEIITAPMSREELEKCMQEDLYRYFRAVAKKELRSVKCYAMVANANIERSFTNNRPPSDDFNPGSLKKFMYNKSIDVLLQNFDGMMDRPVLNETGIKQNIDIDFPFDFYTYTNAQFKEFFFEKGLTLIEVTRDLPVAVLGTAPLEKKL